jgi:DNA-binding transcriptional MerR regulator
MFVLSDDQIDAIKTEPEVLFSAAEVCNLAGITYRQMDYWLRNGYIVRDRDEAVSPGSGMPRHFSQSEAEQFAVIAKLVRCGLRTDVAAVAAKTYNGAETIRLPGGALLSGWK